MAVVSVAFAASSSAAALAFSACSFSKRSIKVRAKLTRLAGGWSSASGARAP